MPFDPALDAAGLREQVVATWSNGAILARYPSARDGNGNPAAGFFDNLSAAQAVIDARAALIGVERRRFVVVAQDVVWIDPAAGPPSVQLIDAEQVVLGVFVVTRHEVDLEAETTTFELLG